MLPLTEFALEVLEPLSVSRELRSYVLSHGRTGVQDKHHDKWTHLPQKRRVLQKWARFVKKVIAGSERGEPMRRELSENTSAGIQSRSPQTARESR
jgi:hypothetical protein